MAYRRYSNDGPSWQRNSTFPPGAKHNRAPSPAFMNPRSMQGSLSAFKSIVTASPSQISHRPTSEKSTLYQSTSKDVSSPYVTPPASAESSTSKQPRSEGGTKDRTEIRGDTVSKGKEPAIVTRPIFHSNLEEAKKYHENRLKNLAPKKNLVSCEEIISRYCDHFKFQLPTLEVIRYKESTKRRVFLRIKRRLVGIGEGQTTFEAMLAAYDDTVLYLFNGDSELKKLLLQPNESIEWNHKKSGNKWAHCQVFTFAQLAFQGWRINMKSSVPIEKKKKKNRAQKTFAFLKLHPLFFSFLLSFSSTVCQNKVPSSLNSFTRTHLKPQQHLHV